MQICKPERTAARPEPTLPLPRGPISRFVIDMLLRPVALAPPAGWLDDVDPIDGLVGDDSPQLGPSPTPGQGEGRPVAIQLDEYGLGEQAVHSALEITSSLCSRPRIYA